MREDDVQDDADDVRDDEQPDAGFERRRASGLSRAFDALPRSSNLWNALAGAAMVAAAVCVLTGHVDAAFVVATLGVLAWFIDKRNRLQESSREARESQGENDG